MKKYKFIDLFAGCGGLEDGFLQSGRYIDIAAVEWLKPQVNTLIRRLETKWKVEDAAERVMHFDIQRETELFAGWDDEKFGSGKGLDYFVNKAQGIDVIIGGPPCQAYSIAGRVRDENGMRDDYRNYLFEHYLSVVNRYRPKAEKGSQQLELNAQACKLFENIETLFEENYLSSEYRKEDVQIGHTYFLVDSKDKLMKRFEYQIIPILKEYYKDGIINFEISDETDGFNGFLNCIAGKINMTSQREDIENIFNDLIE